MKDDDDDLIPFKGVVDDEFESATGLARKNSSSGKKNSLKRRASLGDIKIVDDDEDANTTPKKRPANVARENSSKKDSKAAKISKNPAPKDVQSKEEEEQEDEEDDYSRKIREAMRSRKDSRAVEEPKAGKVSEPGVSAANVSDESRRLAEKWIAQADKATVGESSEKLAERLVEANASTEQELLVVKQAIETLASFTEEQRVEALKKVQQNRDGSSKAQSGSVGAPSSRQSVVNNQRQRISVPLPLPPGKVTTSSTSTATLHGATESAGVSYKERRRKKRNKAATNRKKRKTEARNPPARAALPAGKIAQPPAPAAAPRKVFNVSEKEVDRFFEKNDPQEFKSWLLYPKVLMAQLPMESQELIRDLRGEWVKLRSQLRKDVIECLERTKSSAYAVSWWKCSQRDRLNTTLMRLRGMDLHGQMALQKENKYLSSDADIESQYQVLVDTAKLYVPDPQSKQSKRDALALLAEAEFAKWYEMPDDILDMCEIKLRSADRELETNLRKEWSELKKYATTMSRRSMRMLEINDKMIKLFRKYDAFCSAETLLCENKKDEILEAIGLDHDAAIDVQKQFVFLSEGQFTKQLKRVDSESQTYALSHWTKAHDQYLPTFASVHEAFPTLINHFEALVGQHGKCVKSLNTCNNRIKKTNKRAGSPAEANAIRRKMNEERKRLSRLSFQIQKEGRELTLVILYGTIMEQAELSDKVGKKYNLLS